MEPDQIEKVIATVHAKCMAQAEAEMSARILKFRQLGAEIIKEIPDFKGGGRYSLEDICHAAAQDSGMNHPRTLQVMAARADELLAHFVSNAIAESADANAEQRRGPGRPRKEAVG